MASIVRSRWRDEVRVSEVKTPEKLCFIRVCRESYVSPHGHRQSVVESRHGSPEDRLREHSVRFLHGKESSKSEDAVGDIEVRPYKDINRGTSVEN